MRMADADLREEIERVEAEIDALEGMLDRCRKLILTAKLAIAFAGIWFLAVIFGAISFNPGALVGAIAAIIGGTVVFGSNVSTSQQTGAAIKAAETRRAELIGRIDLRLVGSGEPGT